MLGSELQADYKTTNGIFKDDNKDLGPIPGRIKCKNIGRPELMIIGSRR